MVAASRHSEPQVPGVVGSLVVVVVVVVVVDEVVVSGVVVSDVSVVDAVDVEARSDLRSILLPTGGSTDGHPANSVVVFTLEEDQNHNQCPGFESFSAFLRTS